MAQNADNMETHKYTNRLIHEKSPYLLQHAHNPVDWYPWGEEALERARTENKVLLISIGYAACHWCHVMERESFENEEVAKVMNEFFVCIKVDREERPDIDQIYMAAVQLMTGQGGWPLNCFALPDGRPFFGGSYFRPSDWGQILKGVEHAFLNETLKVRRAAEQISRGIQVMDVVELKQEPAAFTLDMFTNPYDKWRLNFDNRNGGNNWAPKFPMPGSCRFLLRYHHYTGNKSALAHLTLTLDRMANGGIFDQVGGGFARYSTDKEWLVPHFEKMLYDNAQLVSLYSEAYQLTGNPLYREVVEKTLEFVERELSLSKGGFYSSLDADSEGVEGKFYVWSKQEVDDLLGDDAPWFNTLYDVTREGNWEGVNILREVKSREDLKEEFGLEESDYGKKTSACLGKLLEAREKRVRPGLDDKVLTSWNALMLKGYVDAYKALGREEYLERALKSANFLLFEMLKEDSSLYRNYKDGSSGINGFLDDYSFTIEAFVALYQVTFDIVWLKRAEDLLRYTLVHFLDEQSGMFYYTSDEDPELIARKLELVDNVIPSSNSSMAKGLFLLGSYLDKPEYLQQSRQMVANVQERVEKSLEYHSNWAMLMMYFIDSPFELAIVGEDAREMRAKIDLKFHPDVLVSGSVGKSELPLLKNRYVKNETMLYLCKNRACNLPVSEVKLLLDQLDAARHDH